MLRSLYPLIEIGSVDGFQVFASLPELDILFRREGKKIALFYRSCEATMMASLAFSGIREG